MRLLAAALSSAVCLVGILLHSSAARAAENRPSRVDGVRTQLGRALPTLGHRNWIVIADMAYPAQSCPGIETRYVGGDQLAVVRSALEVVAKSRHVRGNVYLDQELDYVAEQDAPGVSQYREGLKSLLQGAKTETLPHETIIAKLAEAAQTFRVLILKTDATIPYTSVFIQLDCGYWSAEAEQRLRAAMPAK